MRTAPIALIENIQEAEALIEKLQQFIEKMKMQPNVDWGHVGDMAMINELLENATDFLKGEE